MSKKNKKQNNQRQVTKVRNLARRVLFDMSQKFFAFVITPLLRWACEDDDKENFFFLVIGNGLSTHVAFANADKLISDGAVTIAGDPKAAAVFESIHGGFDICIEDCRKDPDFEKIFQEYDMCPEDGVSHFWYSYDWSEEDEE